MSEIPMTRPGKIVEREQFRVLGKEVDRLIDENVRLRAELSKHAIVERHRMASGGGTVKIGYWCKVCDSEWSNGQAPRHAANCLLARAALKSHRPASETP